MPDTDAIASRRATLRIVEDYCASNGFAVPPLTESENGGTVTVAGTAPDGREFRIGYERSDG